LRQREKERDKERGRAERKRKGDRLIQTERVREGLRKREIDR
jgi:hypothetical protein